MFFTSMREAKSEHSPMGWEEKMDKDDTNQHGYFNEKDDFDNPDEGFGESGEGTQNLPQDSNLEDNVDSAEVPKDTEEIEAEQRLQEFFKEFMPYSLDSTARKEGANLMDKLKAADEISLFLFHPVDLTKMGKEERKQHQEKLGRKIKFYNALRKVGINLYRWEAGRFLRRSRKIQGQLQEQVDTFCGQLRGVGATSEDSSLYHKILENVPEHLKGDQKYAGLMNHLRQKTGVGTNGHGLKAQLREYGQQSVFLADLDDLIQGTITSYDEKLDTLQRDTRGLNEQLAKDPRNKKLMQERAKKNMLVNTYEEERDKYTDGREEVVRKLEEVQYSYGQVERQVDLREVAILKSRKSLSRLGSSIRLVGQFIKDKQDMLVFGDHLVTLDQACSLAEGAEFTGSVYGMMAADIYTDMMERESSAGQEPYIPDDGLRQVKNALKAKRDEEIESFKVKVRARYT